MKIKSIKQELSYVSKRVDQSIEFNVLFENLKKDQRERVLGILEGMNLSNELLENKNDIC